MCIWECMAKREVYLLACIFYFSSLEGYKFVYNGIALQDQMNNKQTESWILVIHRRNCVSDCGSNNSDSNIMILFVSGWVVETWQTLVPLSLDRVQLKQLNKSLVCRKVYSPMFIIPLEYFRNQVNKCKASEFVNTSKNGWRWMS